MWACMTETQRGLGPCDLILFAGQSNMAGRGITGGQWAQPAPALIPGAGYEYRAVSDPGRLYPLGEPFGAAENHPEGICEPGKKTGSLVTAFVNAYYQGTGRPVVGVSASQGGSAIARWQGEKDLLTDALERFGRADAFLRAANLPVSHRFLAWCQGETDGDLGTTAAAYQEAFRKMWQCCRAAGMERCFLIAIGQYNGVKGFVYDEIHAAQLELARQCPDVELVSDGFWTMRARGLMKDSYHYYQQAYNEVGTAAGAAAAARVGR